MHYCPCCDHPAVVPGQACPGCGNAAVISVEEPARGRRLTEEELRGSYLASVWICPACGRTGEECSACINGVCDAAK